MIVYMAISAWLVFLLTIAENLDKRRPMSSKIRYKFRVKDDSVLRKIIKFKDQVYYPCNYFKIVPIYVYLILSLISSLLVVTNALTDGVIAKLISENIFLYTSIAFFVVYLLYFLVVNIWWEIEDYKEMKLTKEEMKELKQSRRLKKWRK